MAFEELTGHALGRPRSWVTCTAANAKGIYLDLLTRIRFRALGGIEFKRDARDYPAPLILEATP